LPLVSSFRGKLAAQHFGSFATQSANSGHWHQQIGDTHFIAGSENTGAGPFL
jgi:hypothetical protein